MKFHLRVGALAACVALVAGPALAQPAPQVTEGDYVVRDFHFRSGESLPQLRLHYSTLGQPRRDASGQVVNAVLILHGAGGDGHQFIRPQFSGVLFGPGGLLDAAKWYIRPSSGSPGVRSAACPAPASS